MLRNFFSIYFWVTFVALTIASALFWLGSFRHVEGEVSILMLPKVERASVAPTNAATLLASHVFEKQLVTELSSEVSPINVAILDDQEWKELVQAEVLPGSSILHIGAALESRAETKYFLEALTKQLVQNLSQLYNMQSELDLRVIDGPTFETRVASWPGFVGASIGSGFGVTVGFFLTLALLEWAFTSQGTQRVHEETPHISPETFRPMPVSPYWSRPEVEEREEMLPQPETVPFEESEPVYPYEETFSDPNPADVITGLADEIPTSEETEAAFEMSREEEQVAPATLPQAVATGPAPDNLPIADLSPLEEANARLVKADIDAVAETQAKQAETEFLIPEESHTAEPTQEEYKRRLNELLSGRL